MEPVRSIVSPPKEPPELTEADAKALEADICLIYQQEVIKVYNSLRQMIYEFYSRKGWKALGYSSWGGYIQERGIFQEPGEGVDPSKLAPAYVWDQIRAAQVELILAASEHPLCNGITIGTFPERLLRPIAPLKQVGPEPVVRAWLTALDKAAEAKKQLPTAKQVDEIAEEIRSEFGISRAQKKAEQEKRNQEVLERRQQEAEERKRKTEKMMEEALKPETEKEQVRTPVSKLEELHRRVTWPRRAVEHINKMPVEQVKVADITPVRVIAPTPPLAPTVTSAPVPAHAPLLDVVEIPATSAPIEQLGIAYAELSDLIEKAEWAAEQLRNKVSTMLSTFGGDVLCKMPRNCLGLNCYEQLDEVMLPIQDCIEAAQGNTENF